MTEYLFVDRKSPTIMEAIATAQIYKKQGKVSARPAVAGEIIATILKNGAQETCNIAKTDEWVVTNPSGEQYLVLKEKFFNRYEPTEIDGIYTAKGFCRAIKNPFCVPVEILASWGTLQNGDANCMFADTCDSEGKIDGEPYIIDGSAFLETYK